MQKISKYCVKSIALIIKKDCINYYDKCHSKNLPKKLTKATSFSVKEKKRSVKRINAIGDDAKRRSPVLEPKRNKQI